MSFPAVSSAPTSTSREVTRAPRIFSSSVELDFERVSAIGEEVGEGRAMEACGDFNPLYAE